MTYSDGVCCTARVIFPVISSITPRVIEICTISALQVTVTLAGLQVTAVEAAVRRTILFSPCRETRSLLPFGT